MLKQSLLVLLAASLISIAAPFAVANRPTISPPRRATVAGTTAPPIPPSAPRN